MTFPNGQTLTSSALTTTQITNVFQVLITQMLGIMVNQPYIASLTVGSNVITLPTVSGIGDGFQISGTGIPANTVVFLINGNTITITANATITAANETVYFTDPLSNSTVRAAWPIAGAPFAGISDNFITIQFYEADDDYNKVRNLTFAYNNPTSLDQTYTYTRVWRCNLISRGPNCLDNLRLVKSALLMDWVSASLSTSNLYVVPSLDASIYVPEEVNGQWWQRADFSFKVYEGITETTAVNAILANEILAYDADGLQIDVKLGA